MGREGITLDPELAPLVLASASPRRRRILDALGLPFIVHPADVEEGVDPAIPPEANAEILARRKACAVSGMRREGTVIGCDTLVSAEGVILGKPSSAGDARRILSFLSGKVQCVISGLCLIHVPTGRMLCDHAVTRLWTRPMSAEEIDAYVATGECFGKAGAYAIQETGDRFIERMEGSFHNVVGFPTELFLCLMETLSRSVRNEDDE